VNFSLNKLTGWGPEEISRARKVISESAANERKSSIVIKRRKLSCLDTNGEAKVFSCGFDDS